MVNIGLGNYGGLGGLGGLGGGLGGLGGYGGGLGLVQQVQPLVKRELLQELLRYILVFFYFRCLYI